MSPESKPNAHILRRRAIGAVLGPVVFRSETIMEPGQNGMRDFEDKLLEGYGGIIVLKHFSLKDPPQVMKDIVFSSPVMRSREVIVPNALHQIYPGLIGFARFLGIAIAPIVTENTRKRAEQKGKPVPELNGGLAEFTRSALSVLSRGGIVALAPEAERRSSLEPYGKPTIGLILLAAQRLKIEDIALLSIDLRLVGREGYWGKKGFNPLDKYEVRIGRTLTMQEVVAMANGRTRDIDEKVILPEMQRTAAIPRPSRV